MGVIRKAALILLCAAALFIIQDPAIYAETFDDAMDISVNQEVVGNVTEGYKVQQNYYRFYAPDDGYVVVELKYPQQGNSYNYWDYYLYTETFYQIVSNSAAGNKTSSSLPAIGVKAGHAYYVRINAALSAYYGDFISNDDYTLTVKFEASNFWECEFNENFEQANEITENTAYFGTTKGGYNYTSDTDDGGELDYYVCHIPENGAIRVKFGNVQQSSSSQYWRVKLYDSEYHEYYEYYLSGNYTMHYLPWVGVRGDKDYYICVCSKESHKALSWDKYSVELEYVKSDLWETEFNDSYTSANEIRLGEEYSGTVRDGYDKDKDYYRVEITERDTYVVDLCYDKGTSEDVLWQVELFDSNYSSLTKFDCKGNYEGTWIRHVLSPGVYYILVKSPNQYSSKSTDVYKLSVEKMKQEPKSVSLGDKKIILKKGSSYQLFYTLKPDDYSTTVSWISSNKNVATVSKYGLVKAKKKGTCKITVKTTEGKKATCKVIVK